MARVNCRFLGTPQLELEGMPLKLSSRKGLALLAYLSFHTGFVPREELATLLWCDLDSPGRHKALSQTLWILKEKGVGSCLEIDDGIRLTRNDDLWVDVLEFRNKMRIGRANPAKPPGLGLLSEAVDLCRGSFLEGFVLRGSHKFDSWQFLRSETLDGELREAFQLLATGWTSQGELNKALQAVLHFLSLDPYSESMHREALRLYCWTGRRVKAMHCHREFEKRLRDELGVTPERETAALYEDLITGRLPPPSSPPRESKTIPRSQPSSPTQPRAGETNADSKNGPGTLPHTFGTPLFGRKQELREITERIAEPSCRLLVLVGIGGVGKTRLAIRIGQEHQGRFEDGCCFVHLLAVDSPEELLGAIAGRLGIPLEGEVDPAEQLARSLRSREILLILDNFEHLLAAGALLEQLLWSCPRLKILVTSRQPTQIAGEWLYEINGLPCPQRAASDDLSRSDAAKLLVECARRAHDQLALEEGDRAHLFNICRELGGLPLGLELAASWIRVLSWGEIARELNRPLELTVENRSFPERHRSLAAVLEATWRLLTPKEKSGIEKLSVFRHSFTRQAAEEVAEVDLALLATLRDKSLLQRREEGRYELHPLIQRYARRRGEACCLLWTRTLESYTRYYFELLDFWSVELRGAGQLAALHIMDREIENIQEAWKSAVARNDWKAIDKGVEGLYRYCLIRSSLVPAARLLDRAFRAQRNQSRRGLSPKGARVGLRLGRIYSLQGRNAKAIEILDLSLQVLRRSRPTADLALALSYRGVVRTATGIYSKAWVDLGKALEISRAIRDPAAEAGCLLKLGRLAGVSKSSIVARGVLQQSLLLYEELGDPSGIAACYLNLGGAANVANHFTEAEDLFCRSLEICRSLGHRRNTALALYNLAAVSLKTGELEKAEKVSMDAVRCAERLGSLELQTRALIHFGLVSVARGETAKAKSHYRKALELSREGGLAPLSLETLVHLAELLMREGRLETAYKLAAFVWLHRSTERETKSQVRSLQSALHQRMTGRKAISLLLQARSRSLDVVIQEVLEDPFLQSSESRPELS